MFKYLLFIIHWIIIIRYLYYTIKCLSSLVLIQANQTIAGLCILATTLQHCPHCQGTSTLIVWSMCLTGVLVCCRMTSQSQRVMWAMVALCVAVARAQVPAFGWCPDYLMKSDFEMDKVTILKELLIRLSSGNERRQKEQVVLC